MLCASAGKSKTSRDHPDSAPSVSQAPFSLFSEKETEASSAGRFVQVLTVGKLESSEAVSHGFLLEMGEQAGPLCSSQEPLLAQGRRHVGMAAHGPGALLQKLQVGAKPSGMAPPFPSVWRQRRG